MDLIILVGFLLLIKWFTEWVLKTLNERKIVKARSWAPDEINRFFTQEKWLECSNYNLSKSKFSKVEDFLALMIGLFSLFIFLPWFLVNYPLSSNLSSWEVAFAISIFMFVLTVPNFLLDWFYQFRVEQKYGFNKQTFRFWCFDKIKESFVSFIFMFLVFAVLSYVFRNLILFSPQFWWVIASCVILAVQLVLMIIWPIVIMPLFNSFTPLKDESLLKKIQKLSEKTGFKTHRIEVIDGSKRSGHSNAFFTGFGNFRRIILFDTLLEQMNENEIESVVAHEIGHYRLGHIPKRIAASFLMGLIAFYFIDLFYRNNLIVEQFELPQSLSGSIECVLLFFILFGGVVTYWFQPLGNMISRKNEYEADEYASSVVGGSTHLRSALKHLCEENLSYPLPHPLLSWFHHSHPSVLEREVKLLGSDS